MVKRYGKKRALLTSILSMILCVAMLIGTTMAWFVDSASNTGNRIQTGKFKIDLLMDKQDGKGYVSIKNGTAGDIFSEATGNGVAWEPGKTEIVFLQVENQGNLALNYNINLVVTPDSNNSVKVEEVLSYAVIPNITASQYNNGSFKNWEDILKIKDVETADELPVGEILAAPNGALEAGTSDYFALAVHMDEDAGNEYQDQGIQIDVNIVAKQMASEYDSFGNQYDVDAPFTEKMESDPGEQWILLSDGWGDFETSEAQGKWANYQGVAEAAKFKTDDAPSGTTYLCLEDGGRQGYNGAGDIEKGVTYKLTGMVKAEGTRVPEITLWNVDPHDGVADIYHQMKITGLTAGEWTPFEIEFDGTVNTYLWFTLNNRGDGTGAICFDNIQLFRKEGGTTDPIKLLAQEWLAQLAEEEANSMMVKDEVDYSDPYTAKEPVAGSTSLIANGDFTTGAGTTILKSGDDNSIANATGWMGFANVHTGWGTIENTAEGTLKISHAEHDKNGTRSYVYPYAIYTMKNFTTDVEYQISFDYRMPDRGTDAPYKEFGPGVNVYGWIGDTAKTLASFWPVDALEQEHKSAPIADGQWHTMTYRFFVEEEIDTMRLEMSAYLNGKSTPYIEFDNVELHIVTTGDEILDEIELDTDAKFYYTDMDNAKLEVTLASVFEEYLDGSVEFLVYDGQTLVWSSGEKSFDTQRKASAEFSLSYMLKLNSPYVVLATLYDKDGNEICKKSDDIFIFDRPSAIDDKGNYVKFGEDWVYVSASNTSRTPRYPFNCYEEEMEAMGLTTLSYLGPKRSTAVQQALDVLNDAQKHGKKASIDLYGIVPGYLQPAGHPDQIEKVIEVLTSPEIRNHPALLGYYTMDEPFGHEEYTQEEMKDLLENGYRLIRKFDTENMIYHIENVHIMHETSQKYTDVFQVDPYHPAAGAQVYKSVKSAVDAVGGNKPVWGYLEAFHWQDLERILSGDEVRNNNWQTLIAGAEGLGYYSLGDPYSAEPIPMWHESIKRDDDPNTGKEMYDAIVSFVEKEQELAFDHFVRDKSPYFNEEVAIEDGYIYSSWVVDNEVYVIVLNVAGVEKSVSVPLTSTVGNVSIGAYTASIVAGSDSTDAISGNGSLDVTLNADEAILYKITPGSNVDFSSLK